MKYIYLILISLLSILIIRINSKLHSENLTYSEKKADIILQLNFLESELKTNNLGERMQQAFPEGFVFVSALYGLSWCELALANANDFDLKEKAITEALFVYYEIDSERAKRTFDKNLKPEYGIFYVGWKNYLLSKILSVDTTFQNHDKYVVTFRSQCDTIKTALKNSGSPYLQSYNSQAWPADMFVAMASLCNYDRIFKTKYEDEINVCIKNVKERLDSSTGMIPHKVDSRTGKSIQGSRGSSMSLMLRMMAEINADFAKEQFNLFETNFVSKTAGLPSVREYPKGQDGSGDIDSGPVIFGVGFSATITAIGTVSLYDENQLGNKLYKTVNAFGFDYKTGNQKKYLFGKLPMADAFIAWGRATDLHYSHDSSKYKSDHWRFKFHLISMLTIILIWIPFFIKKIKSITSYRKR